LKKLPPPDRKSGTDLDSKTKEIFKKIRRIELKSRKIVDSVFSGVYHSAFKGRGIEFDEARTYIPGDDIRSIDWNITARMNEPYVKKFKEERELTLMLLFDASASNEFGSRKLLRGEAAAELSAVIAFSAIKNNDNVGLIIFSDKVEKYIPPKKGREHVLKLIRELLYFKTANSGTDINCALKFLAEVQKKRGIAYLISDMFSPDFSNSLSVVARKHDVTAIRLSDPGERQLPAVGIIDIEDAESGEIITIDTHSPAFKENYGICAQKVEDETARLFKKRGVSYVNIDMAYDHIDQFVRFNLKKVKNYS